MVQGTLIYDEKTHTSVLPGHQSPGAVYNPSTDTYQMPVDVEPKDDTKPIVAQGLDTSAWTNVDTGYHDSDFDHLNVPPGTWWDDDGIMHIPDVAYGQMPGISETSSSNLCMYCSSVSSCRVPSAVYT